MNTVIKNIKNNLIKIVGFYFIGFAIQFLIYHKIEVSFFFPLKFCAIIFAVFGYILFCIKKEPGRLGYVKMRLRISKILILFTLPYTLLFLLLLFFDIKANWIWGL